MRAEAFGLIGKGVGARFVGIALGVLAGVATLVLTVRLLDTDTYGSFAFALSAATILAGLGRLGLEPAVTRMIAVERERAAMARAAHGGFTIVAASGVAGALALLVVIEVGLEGLEQGTRFALAAGLGLYLYGSNVAAVGGSVARGAGRVVLMELPNLAATLVRLAAVALLTLLDVVDLAWVAAGYGAAAVVTTAIASHVTADVVTRPFRAFRIDWQAAGEVFTGALPFAMAGVAMVILSRFDVVMLGFTGTVADVGAYEPTLRIVEQAMLIVPLLFVAQYLPVASRVHAERDNAQFRELYLSLSKLTFVVAFPAVVLFAAFPEPVLHMLYGEDYPVERTVVWLLLGGFVANLAFGLNASALGATGGRRALATTGAVAIVAMIVLSVVLVPVFGPEGAAAATSGTYIVFNIAVAIALARSTGVIPVRTDYAVTLLSSVIPLAAAFSIGVLLEPVGFWEAMGWTLAVSVAWLAVLLCVRAVRREEIRRLLPRRETR